ncbi:hypothetical protein, partial [Saccharicrinis fermentans]
IPNTIMKNFSILYLFLLFFTSCEPKEFFPDPNSQRDENLFGTWRNIDTPKADSSFVIFTSTGYYGNTSFINNNQITGFTNLDGLWYNLTIYGLNDIGKYYTASTSKHWTNGRWESESYYILNETNDTLYLGSSKDNLNDIYIRNDYQLIYDGPDYVGIDSIMTE